MTDKRPEFDSQGRTIPWDWIFRYPLSRLEILKADEKYYIVYPKGFAENNDIAEGKHIEGGRLDLGDYLTKMYPDEGHTLPSQLLIDQLDPLDFGGDMEDVNVQQLWERVDMARSVMSAGGACTSCGAEPAADGEVPHRRGCEYLSAVLWQMQQPPDPAEEPTLEQVIQAAQDQIDRMN